MFVLAYLPILGLCVLLGLLHAPVSTFIREFTRTLDVPQAYATIDAVVDTVQECVVFPSRFIFYPLIGNCPTLKDRDGGPVGCGRPTPARTAYLQACGICRTDLRLPDTARCGPHPKRFSSHWRGMV